MKVSLQLFSHVDDAWEDNVCSWLEIGTRAALSGQKVWLVCRSFLQANWLRRRSMEERKPIMGIRFLDLRRLRRELCLRAGLPTPSFGRETLSLLLRARMGQSQASSAFPGQVLDALDDLAACGWLDRFGSRAVLDLLDIPEEFRDSVEQIVSSLLWRPRVDRALVEKGVKIPGLRIGFFGLDARALNQQELLTAAVNASGDASLWLAQPFVSEDIFMHWIGGLESRLGGVVTVTPSEGKPRLYEDFVSRFLYSSGPLANLPRLVRAERWSDQTRAVLAIVQSEFHSGSRNVAVIVPEGSPTGPAVVEALTSAGIAVADEFRSKTTLGRSERVLRWLAEWIGEPQTPEKLLEFFSLLSRAPETFARFREYLFRRFDRRQTRLVAQLLPSDSSYPWARDLLSIGSDWPVAGTWKHLETNWQNTLSAFEEFLLRNQNVFRSVTITLEPLQANWAEIQDALGDLTLSSNMFLRFIADSLSNSSRASHPEASHRYAPVVVSTPEQLHATSWDSMILTDGVSDLWTNLASRDSLLGQEFRSSARRQGFVLVSPQEESLLREDSILQLLLHARRSATVCFYGREENGEEVDANRFVTFLERILHAEATSFAPAPIVPTNDFGHLKEIRKFRCNPERAFDEYLLNFSSLELNATAWSASRLQTAIAAPGSFAFQVVFGLDRSWDLGFERDARKTLGIVVHRLLAHILRNPFGDLFENGLSDLRESWLLKEGRGPDSHRYMKKLVRELDLPRDDPWWSSIVDKSIFFVERMLADIGPWLEKFPYGVSELSTGEWTVGDSMLALKGRFDLLLATANALAGAEIAIVDFKTAGSPRQIKADTGEGFQFVAYRLLTEALGANCRHQIAVFATGSKDLRGIREPEEIERKLTELAWMQRQSCFGHAPLLSGEFGIRETLPIATLAIPAWILRKKRVLTLWQGGVARNFS
ncbi:MAG: PD-(D/E)XK nuclease family protein [Chthoniobacterales bacterium]